MLAISQDTTIRFFYTDSLTVDYRPEKPIFRSFNKENIKYNLFYNDLSITSFKIFEADRYYFLDKEDSIIKVENYINNYLSKSDSLITQQVDVLCKRYEIPQKIKVELLSNELETQKLARSYFYLGSYIPKLKSNGNLQTRLQYYINKINQQHLSIFSQFHIALLTHTIALQLTHKPIRTIKNIEELKKYYADMQSFFTKGTNAYSYLVSSLEAHAKYNKIPFKVRDVRDLKRDAKASIFKKYVQKKYISKKEALKDSPLDKTLYDVNFKSSDLQNVISQYAGKPLVINFWASWCPPCIQKLPEINEYKNSYPNLSFMFISLDQSHDGWKLFLHGRKLFGTMQYRRNYNNQDSIFNNIPEIPKYGFLNKNGQIKFSTELNDSIIKNYIKNF